MSQYTEKDCEACLRCGAFIPRDLAKFHQCKGTDKHLRPANITPEQWGVHTFRVELPHRNIEERYVGISEDDEESDDHALRILPVFVLALFFLMLGLVIGIALR